MNDPWTVSLPHQYWSRSVDSTPIWIPPWGGWWLDPPSAAGNKFPLLSTGASRHLQRSKLKAALYLCSGTVYWARAFMTSCLSTWLNQLTVQKSRLFARSSPRKTWELERPKSESPISVMTTWTMSSHESSCLPNCRPLNVSAHLLLGFVQSV
jgi:hypothetical protein